MAEGTVLETTPKRRKPFWVVSGLWAGGIGLVLIVAVGMVLTIYLHRAESILRKRVIATLQANYDSRVQLAGFSVSAMHGFQVTGTGLELFPHALNSPKPLIRVKKFSFHTSWFDLLRTPMHINTVSVSGLEMRLPPKEQRSNIPSLKGNRPGKIQIFVDQIDVDHAALILESKKPGAVPLDFEIINLHITSVGAGKPMHFHAILVNPKPVGYIDSTASFGPYNTQSPADTPLNGTYSFKNAKLATFSGVGGTLSSTGRYSGTLSHIVVDGETDTPDFSISTGDKPLPLHTTFHAIVDGANGDTLLQPVNATLVHTNIIARGKVIDVPHNGHLITLDITVGNGRIQDMLALAVKGSPIMRGGIQLHAKLDIPPGKQSVIDKLRLKGAFQIEDARFTNPKIQQKIDQVSLRSQGKAEEAKNDTAATKTPGIGSQIKGNFSLVNEKVTLPNLRFIVPGANVAMHGSYNLGNDQLDFSGTARLKAKVSDMVTGWKSVLLIPVNPFFSKNGAGTELPIRITGTRSNPKFQLSVFH
ncbi:MAG TPA: AsmA-like C-terminal region-containing protein [Acidobacteriaceae bacterium]|nr:AsmA-like C-terminal region-containing protein [Acidobacteriaceae bacterium]